MKKIILTSILMCLPLLAQAQSTQNPFESAIQARVAGRADIALAILNDIESQRPLDPRVKFEKGVALAQNGECAAAARTFNRGRDLTEHPEFRRASEEAMTHLCPKLAPFETSVYGQFTAQSNANGGSETDTIIVNGLPFTLSDDALAQRDTHLRIGGRVAYNMPLSHQHYLVPHVGLDLTFKEKDPSVTLRPDVGLSYRFRGDRNDFRVGPGLSAEFEDGDHVSTRIGVFGSGSFTIDPKSALLYSASITQKDLKGSDATEDAMSVTAGYLRRFDRGRKSFRLSLSHQRTDATNFMNDLDTTALTATVTGSFNQKYGYEIYAAHTWVDGDQTDPFFGVRRSDRIATIGANLSLPVADNFFGRPYVGISHTRSTSSFETKNYSNTGLTFGFTRSF